VRISKIRVLLKFFLIILLSVSLAGCGDKVILPSAGQLAEFQSAGPVRPTVDTDRLVKARIGGGPYRVASAEVLELTMPTILQVVTAEEPDISGKMAPYVCRISEAGTITLPVVGEVEAAGKTLAQIESAVINAYHPEYTVTRPSVFARVTEYKMAKVTVVGAVNNPGIYSLRSDQMSLVALLMAAGGIVDEGASLIRIIHRQENVPDDQKRLTEASAGTTEQALRLINERAIARKRAIERSIGPDEIEVAVRPAIYSNNNQFEVQITYEQTAPSSSAGRIVIEHDQRILLTEQVDITSTIQRQALLEKLIRREPRISTADMRQRLCELAELFKPNSGICKGQNNTANENIYKSSYAKFSTGNRRQNPTPNELLDEEPLEILHLGNSLQIREKALSNRFKKSQALVLPVKGLNIPFADVVLQDGDSVIVERLQVPLFTVIGLVNAPGNFPYPPDVRYNLMRALAFAGGLNQVAEPRYATIYRLKPDGTIVSAIFKVVEDSKLTAALNTIVQPGDIVDVAHTPRTRKNLFLERIFRVSIGAYVRPEDLWDDD
jgi:protein involved in polysaccharide export with SLBB domain